MRPSLAVLSCLAWASSAALGVPVAAQPAAPAAAGEARPVEADALPGLAEFAARPAPCGSEADFLLEVQLLLAESQASPGLLVESDAFGTLIVRVAPTSATGSGAADAATVPPVTRLIAVGVDEPGYVVSQIRDDGYLRLRFLGRSATPAFHLSYEGQPVRVLQHRNGREPAGQPGVILVNSIHLRGTRPAQLDETDLWLDVGADSPQDVEALGISLLDPVVAHEVTRLHDGRVAAPGLGRRAAALALLRVLADVPAEQWRDGLAVAFVSQSLPGSQPSPSATQGPLGRGGEGLLRRLQPEAVLMLRGSEAATGAVPGPARLTVNPAASGGAEWSTLELRVAHADTPVESVAPGDLDAFTAALRAEVTR